MICPWCKREISDDTKYCPLCAGGIKKNLDSGGVTQAKVVPKTQAAGQVASEAVKSDLMNCPWCQKEIPAGTKYCPLCAGGIKKNLDPKGVAQAVEVRSTEVKPQAKKATVNPALVSAVQERPIAAQKVTVAPKEVKMEPQVQAQQRSAVTVQGVLPTATPPLRKNKRAMNNQATPDDFRWSGFPFVWIICMCALCVVSIFGAIIVIVLASADGFWSGLMLISLPYVATGDLLLLGVVSLILSIVEGGLWLLLLRMKRKFLTIALLVVVVAGFATLSLTGVTVFSIIFIAVQVVVLLWITIRYWSRLR